MRKKFMFQIGTIIPMVVTNAFQSSNIFLVFVFTLFPAVMQMLLHFLYIKHAQLAIPYIT